MPFVPSKDALWLLQFKIVVVALFCSTAKASGQDFEKDAEGELLSALQSASTLYEGDWFAERTLDTYDPSLRQCRGFSLSVTSLPLQSTDTLNGIAWRGSARLAFVACRTRYHGNALWSEWAVPSPEMVRVISKRGTWRFAAIEFIRYFRKPTTERIRTELQRGMLDEVW
jgi:hypothetical protein